VRRNLSPVEIRVLGCLIEKQRTTPDAYPLTLNSLRLACNQSTNRDPVVDYDEATIREALGELGRRRWARSGSGHGGRSLKYRHLLKDELPLPDREMAVLAVLMLRGPQTPGELKQRADRLHSFAGLGEVLEALEGLIERELVRRLDRRPGQKEERYEQLLGADLEDEDESPEVAAPARAIEQAASAVSPVGDQGAELAELRARVERLERRIERLEPSGE
jgi:uncharacterized protein